MHSPSAIIFDLGRVLVDIDLSRGFFRLLTGKTDASSDEVMHSLCQDPIFAAFCKGQLTPEAFHAEVCGKTGVDLSFEAFAAEWCNIFSMNNTIREVLTEALATARVAILSDTDPLHWHHLCNAFPLLSEVRTAILSYELGLMKPAPEIYLIAARRLQVEPENCFYTDDLQVNVDGALRVGMDALLYRSPELLREALCLRGLLE